MQAKLVRKISAWLCVLLILAVPCTPVVYRWFNPPKTPSHHEGLWGLVTGALDLLGSVTDTFAVLILMMGLGVAAFLASLVALIASFAAADPLWIRWLCALPALTATALVLFSVVLPLLGVG